MFPPARHLSTSDGIPAQDRCGIDLLAWSIVSLILVRSSTQDLLTIHRNSCCIAAIIRLVYLEKSIRGVLGAEQNICSSNPSYQCLFPVLITLSPVLQSRQFVFLIIEPNCSIIAACLPTYGPLFAGGRGLSSIVNSVRSVFSLRSTTSSRNRYANASHDGHQAPNKSDTDSQIELTTQGWGMQDVRVVGGQYDRDSPRMPPHGDRTISVTHGVTIVPQSRS